MAVHAADGAITVRDTGPGLDPEDIPRAFERFYLYGRYRSERPVGSGLGLAIVRELVGAMGGTVEASTAPRGDSRRRFPQRRFPQRRFAEPPSRSGCRLCRHAPLGQMRSDLPLDPLQGVVDGLAVASDSPTHFLVGVAVEVQREHAGFELGQRGRDAGHKRA